MIIERTASEFIIRLPFTSNTERMQDLLDYLRYKELTTNYSTSQSEVDILAREINAKWWKQNQSKYNIGDENLLPTNTIEKAKEWVKDVDFDDFAFVAVADHLDAWLWTGDKKLTVGLRQKGYGRIISTSDLWDIVEGV